jgi:diguanylate cyclase (GGDEF)-like protein
MWSINSSQVKEFLALSKLKGLAPTQAGLIRRAWSTGEPVWIADVSREPTFLRASIAAKAGLHGAFAFPIRIGGELCGVLEFFIRKVCQPDPALLRMGQSIGLQIGQFIARTAAQKQIRQLAHYDFLTGLPNRTLFNQLLDHALVKAQRYSRQLAIMFIDLDGFKQINDRFGHDAGDHLLVTFTLRLRESLRRSDLVGRHAGSDTAARLGGDEFVVLVDEFVDPFELETVAQRILAAAAQPFPLAGPEGEVSASIGISVYPADGTDIESLTKSADSAMYRAKRAGKNTYRFFSGAMNHQSRAATR